MPLLLLIQTQLLSETQWREVGWSRVEVGELNLVPTFVVLKIRRGEGQYFILPKAFIFPFSL